MSEEFHSLINDIKDNYPVLSREEEQELFTEYKKSHSKAIKDKLVLSNVGLVTKTASKFITENKSYDQEDLFSEGIKGLMHAIELYEVDTGNKLSTYAVYWITQYIQRYIENQAETIRIPSHALRDINLIKREERKRMLSGDEEPLTPDEIMELIPGCSRNKAVFLYKIKNQSTVSLNIPVGEEGDMEFLEMLPSDNGDTPETAVIKADTKKRVNELLDDILNEREREIITRRYGLTTGTPETLESIAIDMNLTRERIRQIQDKAERKLKRNRGMRALYRDG